MAKKNPQIDIVVALIEKHQPCTLHSLLQHSDELTLSGVKCSGTILRKFGVIKDLRFENRAAVVCLTNVPYKELCKDCGTPTRRWSMSGDYCKNCSKKVRIAARTLNPEVDAEFRRFSPMCRLMHLPFGLPTQTYVDYLQLRGAAL